MSTPDHRGTASWGSRKSAKAFRAKEAELIKQGKHKEAQQLGIDDVRAKYGSKYDDALRQLP